MAGQYFAPVPNRAYFDKRLRGTHLRILGVVAMHDRMGKNGQHCVLTGGVIARKLDSDPSNVAACIRMLVKWGYLATSANPWHKQSLQLAIVYDEAEDVAALKRKNPGSTDPRFTPDNPMAVDPGLKGNPVAVDLDKRNSSEEDIRNSPEGEDSSTQVAPVSRPVRKSFKISYEEMLDSVLRANSYEAFLGMLDRYLRDGWTFKTDDADSIYGWLEEIQERQDLGENICGWAYRLLETDIVWKGAA